MKFIFLSVFLIFISACQTSPTKVYESTEVFIDPLVEGARKPLKLGEGVIVVDARGSFDYSVSHIEGSYRLDWREFSNLRGVSPGRLKKDLFTEARHLARLGIDLNSKVIIVGKGKKGKGEEGRLAWTFLNMGIRDVQVAKVDHFRVKRTSKLPLPQRMKPLWKPKRMKDLEASKTELLKAITQAKAMEEPIHIIDVRSKKEYFSKKGIGQAYKQPDIQAVHIEWKEFFNSKGRPNLSLKDRLEAVGISPRHRVITISNKGLRSGAAATALLALGYKKAANFSGGFKELKR